MKKTTYFSVLFLGILLSACSITPKYHSVGYHIDWKPNFKQNEHRSTNQKIIVHNQRRLQPIAINPHSIGNPKMGEQVIIAPEKLAITEHPKTKNAQPSNFNSSHRLKQYSQTSDTPITYKQLRKLAPNPPEVVKINRLLRPIRVAMLAFAAATWYSTVLLFDAIFFGSVVTYPNLLVLGVLIAPILFLILSLLEINLFKKRQKILNELYVNNAAAIKLLKYLDGSFYLVFLIPYVGTPIYHLLWHSTFKKLNRLEPNNPYIEMRKRKTRWNMAPGYLSYLCILILKLILLFL